MIERRWIFGADLHLDNYRAWGGEMIAGTNARARLTLDVLQRALALAKEKGATDFALLGDTFNRHNPSPQLVAALASVLAASGLEIHLLVGNHDAASEEPGDHALAPLAHVPRCHVHDQPTVVGDVLFAPFRKAPVKDWLPDLLDHGKNRGCTTLAAHFGLVTTHTPPFLRDAPDAIPLADLSTEASAHGFRHVVIGNWHNPQDATVNGVHIWQCGTLCPHSFNDTHGGQIVDPANLGRFAIAGAPEFVTVDHAFEFNLRSARSYFARIRNVLRENEAEVRAHLSGMNLAGFEIELAPAPHPSLASAIGNAHKSRGALIHEYVGRALKEEPEPVREDVKGKLVEYKVL